MYRLTWRQAGTLSKCPDCPVTQAQAQAQAQAHLPSVGELQHGLGLLLEGVLEDDDGVLARSILKLQSLLI